MVLTDKLNRAGTLAIAGLLFLASLVPLLTRQKASAYGLLPSRSVTMSTSQQGATNTTYHVRFDVGTTAAVGGIVVEFCDNSPIIGDTSCTLPTGFSITATPGVSGQSDGTTADTLPDPVTGATVTGDCDLTPLTTAAQLNTNRTLVLSDGGGNTAGTASLTSGETCFFDITTVTNPTTANHTFYARIMTYDTENNALAYDPTTGATNPGPGNIDAGGIALSTAEQINITAKVQERLTFCVYTFPTVETTPGAGDWTDTPSQADTGTGNDCAGKSGSDIILGDVNGVLDPAQSYVDKTSYFSITTNASGQAAVRMKGDTLELTPGCAAANCRIDAVGATPALSAATTEQFGMCLYKFDNVVGSTFAVADGSVSGDVDYTGEDTITPTPANDCSDTSQSAHVASAPAAVNGDGGTGHGGSAFAFDVNNLNTLPYGQIIARKQAGGFTTARMAFLGNINNTTEPGIYRTTLTFIATGTY